jgi:heptosyltransferase-3
MVFDPSQMRPWPAVEALQSLSMMHVGCRQKINRWTIEGWIRAGKRLLELGGALVISSGPAPDELEIARAVQAGLPGPAFCSEGKTTWLEMAWLLSKAKVFVTVNTASMHLAAACQTPTVALFGPSIEDHWHPWKAPHKVVCQRGFKREPGPAGFSAIKNRPMSEIDPADVIAACEELIAQEALAQSAIA